MIEFRNTTPVLKASDIQATVEFYTQVLGFRLDTLRPGDQPTLCILDHGNVHLMFDANADWDSPGANPSITGQLLFEVNDVTDLYDNIREKAEVLWGPEVYSYNRREFSVRDPNGYRLVFSEDREATTKVPNPESGDD